jgi:putative transposase
MPRKPRFFLPGAPVHAIQRGNNRQAVFFDDEDYRVYLGWLKLAGEKYDCRIHAYVLMTNHVHLLVTPNQRDSLSGLFQYVGRHYVAYVNHTYGRTGTLWEGRYKASLIEEERYLLTCYRYIEMNPVRAGMVNSPEQYDWSSYRYNALGEENPLLFPHPIYGRLAKTDDKRQAVYRALFNTALDATQLDEVRVSTQSGTPLGNARFRAEIEHALQVKVGQTHRGRPAKVSE